VLLVFFARKMKNVFRFTTIRDLNTFQTILKKGWEIEVECIGQNNPLLIYEDRIKVALEIEKKFKTVCCTTSVSLNNFVMERIKDI